MKKTMLAAALMLSCAFAAPSLAQDMGGYENNFDQNDSNYLSFGLGWYDVFDNDGATDFRLEYRSGDNLFWKLKPWGGVEATNEGSVWVGAGLAADFMAAPAIYITPSFGVGLYAQGGSDLDLGHPIEFRSQIEGGYEFVSGHRVGVALSNISNFGLDDDNPGTQVLGVYYHLPVGDLF